MADLTAAQQKLLDMATPLAEWPEDVEVTTEEGVAYFVNDALESFDDQGTVYLIGGFAGVAHKACTAHQREAIVLTRVQKLVDPGMDCEGVPVTGFHHY